MPNFLAFSRSRDAQKHGIRGAPQHQKPSYDDVSDDKHDDHPP